MKSAPLVSDSIVVSVNCAVHDYQYFYVIYFYLLLCRWSDYYWSAKRVIVLMYMSILMISVDVLTIEQLKRETGVDDSQLATMIREEDINKIAGLFDEVETYLDKLGLLPAQQTDVKDIAYRHSTTQAMTKALKLWRQPDPYAATFRALLEILLDLRRGDVALKVCQYVNEEVPKQK